MQGIGFPREHKLISKVLGIPANQPFDFKTNLDAILSMTKGKRVILVSDYDGVMVPTIPGKRPLSRGMVDTVSKFFNLPNADFKILTGRNYVKIKNILRQKLEGHGIMGYHPLANGIDVYGSDGNEFNAPMNSKWKFKFEELRDRVMNVLSEIEIGNLYDYDKDLEKIKSGRRNILIFNSKLSDMVYKAYVNFNCLDFQFAHISKLKINEKKFAKVQVLIKRFADEIFGEGQYILNVDSAGHLKIFPKDPDLKNKGDAIDQIYREASSNTIVLFFGDDFNDIPALDKVQERGGVAVQVARKIPRTPFYEFENNEAVLKVYQAIAEQKTTEYRANLKAT